MVFGYDDSGYYYAGPGCDDGRGPKAWKEFADTGIGVLETYSISPGKAISDNKIVKNALSFAIKIAQNPADWIFDGYRAGIDGYNTWIKALKSGVASDMGTRYNSGVWYECRRFAAAFLREARERLPGRADQVFDKAIASYTKVSESLETVSKIYPWHEGATDEDTLPVDDNSRNAVTALEHARDAEAEGLGSLREIAEGL